MTELDPSALATRVLWAAFALSLAFGAIAQRTNFCTMGAVADVVNMGDWTRARMWALAIAMTMLGFNTMVGLGWIEARHTIYAGPRLLWMSAIVGGVLFGFGMVLASGCGSKSLIRVGGGNLKSLVVLLVLGIAALVTMRGATAVLRVNTVERFGLDLASGQDLPSLVSASTGLATAPAAAILGSALALALLAWVLRRKEGRTLEVWIGGVGIGTVVAAVWWVSGRLGYLAEDPNTLEQAFLATNSRRMESLSMVAPVGYTLDWLMGFSDKSKLLTLGIVSAVGIFAGSLAMALTTRSFRWEGFGGTEDLANHLVGGALMGVGGVMALGCTVGQGLSGVSTLSLGSFLALISIIAGAVIALRYQTWHIMHEG